MNNNEFIQTLESSYNDYLTSHRRSSKKLNILHGQIANDLQNRLGEEFCIKSLGFNENKEAKIEGRYMNKKVDISIFKGDRELGGISVKYVMTNYAQNTNNYFESMLGETANIRSANKLYFQIIILPKNLPYFGEKKVNGETLKDVITKIERVNYRNMEKYIKLSNDNNRVIFHTPDKTLLYLIKTTDSDFTLLQERTEWIEFMTRNLSISESDSPNPFSLESSFIYNNYEEFISKVCHAVLAM